ncbi:serine/threonine-protein kinase Nek6-like, partial [Capsicum annuum]|uniref:serine/threonine-protein kinase Nek6-like n=1 Tax=Capsicum annuum TaxID=4072 RepID=UPI001FB11B58
VNLIAKLSHPYLLEYKDACVDKGSCICIVADYCDDENMAEVMRKSRGALFPEEKLCKWLTHLLLALENLHSNRAHHRNLKLCNIVITKDNDIRLGDFGLGKLLDAEGLASSVSGTPNNMCPELLASIPYGYKSDIWSLGYWMFDIAAHQPPFKASDNTGLINKINRGLFSPLPIIYSTLKQIIKSMLRKTPEHRPTAAELLRHQHLQPYLLLCHNPSSAFLPVKSPSRTKEKTRPSPGKSISPRGSRDRLLKLKEKRTVFYFDESDNIQPRNLSDNYNTFRAKLDTKIVDPRSYSVRISQDSEDSKSGEMSEAAVCNGYDQQETISQTETMITPSSSSSREKTWSEEQERVSTEHSGKPDAEAAPRCRVAETENGSECREVAIDCLLTESDGSLLHKDELEKKASAVSQLKSLAAIASKEDKDDWGNPIEQRAEALESLLEVCARILKQEKIDKLAGVLKPLGDDGLSSRETAILSTK